ncbi:MAG TPA: diphthine--ammonia ligase [Thermoplasmata archaeon]|nr:diphthine--ammonia ligase [Thermoplasmata archaeon]
MTVTALVSGGKDSLYSAYLAETQAWPIDELLTLRPSDPASMLYHTPNLDLVELQARAWGKPHRTVSIPGQGEEAEGAALEHALSATSGWVVAGAIASNYQWSRLHRVCYRLGRPLFTPLWGKTGERVVREEIAAGLDIRLAHLAAEPLTPELAGRRLDLELLAELDRRSRTVRTLHLAGEGGEFETLVVDAPFFRSRIAWEGAETTVDGGAVRWRPISAHLVPKSGVGTPTPKSGTPFGPP